MPSLFRPLPHEFVTCTVRTSACVSPSKAWHSGLFAGLLKWLLDTVPVDSETARDGEKRSPLLSYT